MTFPMKQGFCITVKWACLCRVITLWLIVKCQEKGSWLNGIQGHFVHSLAKIFNPSPSPWNSRRGRIRIRYLVYVYVQICPVHTCVVVCLFPAVRAASLSSPGWGSEVSLRILWNCISSSLGKRWRPPVYSHTWKKRPLWYTRRCFRSVRCCTISEDQIKREVTDS